MIVSTFAITALIVAALTMRLLPMGRSRAIALAAAIFIASLIRRARTSNSPRKSPGKQSTLLI